MKLNYIISNNEKKILKNTKDSLYKNNIPKILSNHKTTKTEMNLCEENPRLKYNLTTKNMNYQNSQKSFFHENKAKQIKKIFYSDYPLEIPPKAKNSNTKIDLNNMQENRQLSNLKSKNLKYINNKRNTFCFEDNEFPIKKTESFSNIQIKKDNNSIEYHKNYNINNLSMENFTVKYTPKNDYLDLGKIIAKEKKINSNLISPSNSTNNFIKMDPKMLSNINKCNDINKNNNNDYLFEKFDKNSSFNFNYQAVNNVLSFENKNKNLQKYKSLKDNKSASNLGKKITNKKASISGQYYVDIDLSLNSNLPQVNESKNNDLKKSVKEDINSDLTANTNFFSSQLEKIKNTSYKNILDLKNNTFGKYFNKKPFFTTREKIPNNPNYKTRNNEMKNKNSAKSRLIPYSGNKNKQINDNQYLPNSIKEKNNNSINGPKLKKSSNNIKKEFYYNLDPKIGNNYIMNSQNINNDSNVLHTLHNRQYSHEYELNYNTANLPKNYNFNNNNFTDSRLKKRNITEVFDFNDNNINDNINLNNTAILNYNNVDNNILNINEKNLNNQHSLFFTNRDNYDDNNSIEQEEPKTSILYANKRNINDIIIRKNPNRKIIRLNDFNIIHEKMNNNLKGIGKKNSNINLKDINLFNSLNILDKNNYLHLNNFGNKSCKNIYKNKSLNDFITTDVGKEKMFLSPKNICKIDNFHNYTNKKNNNNINLNLDEYNSKNIIDQNNRAKINKIGKKLINYTEYNSDFLKMQDKNSKNINNENNEDSHLLLKSISFCNKKSNNPIKLNTKKKDSKINNKPFNIPSVKRIYQNNNNKFNKFNNTVDKKDINRNNNNNISNYYKKKGLNNIININNNTSNVNVLNVKNSSINIHFEPKEKCKIPSPDHNIIYSTTVNSVEKNNKSSNKSIGNDELFDKKNNLSITDKIKPIINKEIIPSLTRISKNIIKKILIKLIIDYIKKRKIQELILRNYVRINLKLF